LKTSSPPAERPTTGDLNGGEPGVRRVAVKAMAACDVDHVAGRETPAKLLAVGAAQRRAALVERPLGVAGEHVRRRRGGDDAVRRALLPQVAVERERGEPSRERHRVQLGEAAHGPVDVLLRPQWAIAAEAVGDRLTVRACRGDVSHDRVRGG
jgi:hypothetical protein